MAMPKPKTDVLGRPMQYVYRHPSHLAGISYPNKNGKSRVRLARHLHVGTQLIVRLDQDNPADQDAVLVYRADDPTQDLGYLYSFTARSVSRKMRCGASFSGEVASIEDEYGRYPVYRLYVYQLTKAGRQEPKRAPDEYYHHAAYAFGECVQEAQYAPQREDSRPSNMSGQATVSSIEPPRFKTSGTPGIVSRLISALFG